MAPYFARESKSTFRSSMLSGMQAAGRTACLDRLKGPVPDDPAADIKDQIAGAMFPWALPQGPVLFTLSPPGQIPWSPVLVSVPISANFFPPSRMISGMLASVSTLFRTVGWFQSPFWDRADILCPGFSYPSLDRCHESRGFSADKGSSSADYRQMQSL